MDSSKNTADEVIEDEFLPGYTDVNTFSQQSLRAVMEAVRSSNNLPLGSADDWDYYSSFESFRELMSIEGKRLLQMMQTIFRHQNIKGNLSDSSQATETEEKFDVLVDANDQLLERVGLLLDEASGVKKAEIKLVVASVTPKQQINTSWNKKMTPSVAQKSASFRLLAARYIQRPQLKFKDKIDNSYRPFIPKITNKPNAIKPLPDYCLKMHCNEDDTSVDAFDYPHPYQHELDHFKPCPEQITKTESKQPPAVDSTPLTMVTTLESLEKLCQTLKKEMEIAVDLEHHSYRTYLGITCLMQISTRTQDFIIDCIELRSELQLLNDVFTDPNIVKVFHGAEMDIEWLERDLGLYIVNMFDTGQASRVMNFARFSLSHLLIHYCQIEADKQYQLADWRIRPLPDELINYAREDTHYLLYIYDRMKNELLERGNEQSNLLLSVLHRSNQICAKVYKKPVITDESYLLLYKKSKKVYNSQQLKALDSIFSWRDKIAREEDESTGYVLPNHMLLQIAEILPRESQGVLACCNPIPPLVKQNLAEIHKMVMEARESPLEKVSLKTEREIRPTPFEHPKYNANSLLQCPHDLSHRDSVNMRIPPLDPELMASSSSIFKDKTTIEMKSSPTVSIFSWSAEEAMNKRNLTARQKAEKIRNTFASPYEKYLPATQVKMGLSKETISFTEEVDTEKIQLVSQSWQLKKNTLAEKPKANTEQIVRPHQPDRKKPDVLAPQPSSDSLVTPLSLKEQMNDSGHKRKKKKNQMAEEFLDNLAAEIAQQQQQGKKKRKHEEANETEDNLVKKHKGEKSASSGSTNEEPEVQAYDYSKADFKMFERSKKKLKKGEYDPDRNQHKFKAPKRSKLNPSSGKKSMTFSSHKSHSEKQQWPKR